MATSFLGNTALPSATGEPVELFMYKDDNHNISASFAEAMARSVRFFDAYVKGE